MNRLGIENLSVFGLPPVQFVHLAADLGCAHMAITLRPFDYNPQGYPRFALKDDVGMRGELAAALRDRGISLSLGEGFTIRPGADISERAADLDVMCEIGVQRVNTVSMDPDRNRTFDQLAQFAQLAAKAGVEATVELCPGLTIGDLPMALAAVRHVNRPNFRLLIDTMHLIRSGATPADLAAVDPGLIGYVQVCDVPLKPTIPSYMEEATFERMAPGDGELPLLEILSVAPRNVVLSLETPMRRQAEAGIGPRERLAPAVAALRDLVRRLPPDPCITSAR
jgi:sugar phosphate isomerase/epimerase